MPIYVQAHACAYAMQNCRTSVHRHIEVSGAGAALAAMKDVEKVKDLEEKVSTSVGTTEKSCFFFDLKIMD